MQEFAACLRGRQRQAPDLLFVDLALGREEQNRRVRRRYEEARDKILFLRLHAGAAFAATPLCAISRKRHAFDVALVTHGHDHVFTLDQIFVFNLVFDIEDLRASRRRMRDFHRKHLVFDHAEEPRARA